MRGPECEPPLLHHLLPHHHAYLLNISEAESTIILDGFLVTLTQRVPRQMLHALLGKKKIKNRRIFIGASVGAPTAVLRFNINVADVGSDGESCCIPCSTALKTSIMQARPAGVDDGWEGAARYQWADWPPGCGVQHQRSARGAIVANIVSESVFFSAKLLMHEWPGKTEGKHQKCV